MPKPASVKSSHFGSRGEAYRYAVAEAKKKTPNTNISIRKTITVRHRKTPWIVSINQH